MSDDILRKKNEISVLFDRQNNNIPTLLINNSPIGRIERIDVDEMDAHPSHRHPIYMLKKITVTPFKRMPGIVTVESDIPRNLEDIIELEAGGVDHSVQVIKREKEERHR